MFGCILFTDVKSSSRLWAAHPQAMLKMLLKHEAVIRNYVKKNKGLIVKSIGDAFMVYFKTLEQGVICAIAIQKELRDKPIKFSHSIDQIHIRIGLAEGPIQMRKTVIQNFTLKDYFGTTVNMASRMESKVSKVDGFGILADSIPGKIKDLIERSCNVQEVRFRYMCNVPVKRSKRLLIQDSVCYDVKILHVEDGKEHLTYSCVLK